MLNPLTSYQQITLKLTGLWSHSPTSAFLPFSHHLCFAKLDTRDFSNTGFSFSPSVSAPSQGVLARSHEKCGPIGNVPELSDENKQRDKIHGHKGKTRNC